MKTRSRSASEPLERSNSSDKARFFPGDLLVASRSMKAWSTFRERGYAGTQISTGDVCFLVAYIIVGTRHRLYVHMNDRIELFVHDSCNVSLNWERAQHLTRTQIKDLSSRLI